MTGNTIYEYFKSKGCEVNFIERNIWEISKSDFKFLTCVPFLVCGQDPILSKEISESKSRTNAYLKLRNYPHTEQLLVPTIQELDNALEKIGYPCAMKPNGENNGRGVFCNIKTKSQLMFFINQNSNLYANGLILEKHIEGNDYRITIINDEFLFTVQRKPPLVTGDGKKTIIELIDDKNREIEILKEKFSFYNSISVDDYEIQYNLKLNNLTIDSVLDDGQIFILKSISNLSVGGERIYIPRENIHESVIVMCESLSKELNLFSLGIDYITKDISKEPELGKDSIIELNYNPQVSQEYYFKCLDRMIEKYERN